ncbi:ABC transporter permease [Bacteroidota bacterium]
MNNNILNSILRPFKKDLFYSILNIIGLVISLTCAFFITLYVYQEFSYNKSHENYDSVYRLLTTWETQEPNSHAPYPLGPALAEDYPEIKNFSRIKGIRNNVKINDKEISVRTYGVDKGITNIFSFNFLEGNELNLFDKPDEIAISLSTSKKLFGEESPVGKIIECKLYGKAELMEIVAVFEDFPITSTFRPDAIVNVRKTLAFLKRVYRDPEVETKFKHNSYEIYFLLGKGIDINNFESKLDQAEKKYFSNELKLILNIQPLKDVYLHSSNIISFTKTGNLKSILTMIILGILILLIGILNYIILSISRSSLRYREVGILKLIGASQYQLASKFLKESVLISVYAFPIAIILMLLLIPNINNLFGADLEFVIKNNWPVVLCFFGISIIAGIFSGSYLSIYLSRLRPADILRNKLSLTGKRSVFYKILIIIQVVIFSVLLSCSGIISKQIKYMEDPDMGFNRDNLIIVYGDPMNTLNIDIFNEEIRKSTLIVDASRSLDIGPSEGVGGLSVPHFTNPEIDISFYPVSAGYNFHTTMGIELKRGRWFSKNITSDVKEAVIINEEGVKKLGITGDPIGEIIKIERTPRTIIGIVSDFHVQSARDKKIPIFIRPVDRFVITIPVRLAENRTDEAIAFLKQEWSKMYPDHPFEYQFFNDMIAELYQNDRAFGKIIRIFSLLSIIVAMLGLVGLSIFMASRRTREIGIRKINGARVSDIILLLNKNFALLIFLAWIISIPVTELIMSKWLEAYADQISIGTWIIIRSLLISLAIVIAIVSLRAWKAAQTDPVKVIQSE